MNPVSKLCFLIEADSKFAF